MYAGSNTGKNDQEGVFVIILIIIINRKYQPFSLLSYYFVALHLNWLFYHFLSIDSYKSQEIWVFVAISTVQSPMYPNSWVH